MFLVGFFGLNLTATTFSDNSNYSKILNTTTYNTSTNTLYSGIDWVYSYVETLYIYDYNVIYF